MSPEIACWLEGAGRSQDALFDQVASQWHNLIVLFVDELGLLGYPGRVLLGRDDLDERRHERVLTPAQLRALAVVQLVRMLGLEPCVGREARDRIDLTAQRGPPPGVDHVARLDHQIYCLARGNDHLLVGVWKMVRPGLLVAVRAVRVVPDELATG